MTLQVSPQTKRVFHLSLPIFSYSFWWAIWTNS